MLLLGDWIEHDLEVSHGELEGQDEFDQQLLADKVL